MKVGFSGSQHGTRPHQFAAIDECIKILGPQEFHHGDCVGADDDAHRIARKWGARIVIHPPIVGTKRAFLHGDETRESKPYIERNHDIVDETDVLIAAPNSMTERLRSGTWATIRYATKIGKQIYIVYPDGRIENQKAAS